MRPDQTNKKKTVVKNYILFRILANILVIPLFIWAVVYSIMDGGGIFAILYIVLVIFGIPFLVIWYILNLKLIKYKYNEETFSNFAFTMFTIQIIAVVLLIVLNNL
jgi:hypothetical protein